MKKVIPALIIFLFLCISPTNAITAGKSFTNKLNMKFVFIPAGSFIMGSPTDEIGREDDEKQHWVTINKGFYISTTEVTQGQWKKLMGYNPSVYKELGNNGPVDQVSWYDCQEFIEKLNEKEGTDKYRLPTEAEWEYACRAGAQTAFAGGDITEASCKRIKHIDEMAWYCGNSGHRPHRVATKKPNKWGLYDMHGNVHEWCFDHCDWLNKWTRRINVITDTYRNNIIDPVSRNGKSRVFRGGSWNQSTQYLRAADRGCFNPGLRRTDIGFRVVKTR